MSTISKEQRARLSRRLPIASVSGGKDSAALSLWLTENGIEHRRVFADTGWEHPAVYEYLRGPLTEKLGAIDEVRGLLPMADLVRKKGMFPSRLRRFCTEDLKVRPLAIYNRAVAKEIDSECVNVVGIRAAESEARAKLSEWEWNDTFDCDVWRPLLAWTEQDVIDIHTRHGLAPNPLYLRGASRVGCFPCIFARKSEIALVAREWPQRIAEISALEFATTIGAIARGAENPHRTFFRGKTSNEAVPVDEAVEWANTAHGGKQMLLLDTEPAGCVRWGLCESTNGESP